MSVEEFKELTTQNALTQKSTAQKRIVTLLTEYHQLGHRKLEEGAKKKQRKAHAKELESAKNSMRIPDTKLEQASTLLNDMKAATQLWIKTHTVEDDGMLTTRGDEPASGSEKAKRKGTDPKAVKPGSFDELHSKGIVIDGKVVDGTAPTSPDGIMRVNPNRRKRMMGMARFQLAVEAEQEYIAARMSLLDQSVVQDPFERDEQAARALEDHYGDFSTFFSKLGLALDGMVPRKGDSASFEVGFSVPIPETPVMVTGAVVVTASRGNNNNVTAGVDIKPGVAVGIGAANINAAIGIYTKVSARTGADAMTLVSYAVYRSLRQSNVPSEISDKLWGGSAGRFGKLKADKWSRGVEKKVWGDGAENNTASYLEWGMLGEAGIKGEVSLLGVGGELSAKGSARVGSRYDKTSMDNRKGGAGNKNLRSDGLFTKHIASRFGRGAEKDLSRASYTVSVGDTLKAGLFTGDISASVVLRRQGLHKDQRKGLTNTSDWVFEEIRVSGKLTAQIPGGQLVVGGALLSRDIIGAVRDKSEKLTKDAEADAAREVGKVAGMTDTVAVLTGLDKGAERALDFASLGNIAASGSAGLEVEISGALLKSGDKPRKGTFTVDVRLVTGLDLDAFGYATVKMKKGSRLIGTEWDTETREWKRT